MSDAWSARRYAENARFVSELGQGVLDWLAPRGGERILDLGCGDGALTQRLLQAGANVVGIDASADMVDAARAAGIDARVADASVLDFGPEFDAVFSNAALHWMTDPDAVIAGVARALKPGGRFVAEFGGHANVAAIRTALSATVEAATGLRDAPASIWYFPTADEHRARLERGGFAVQRIEHFARPTPIPGDMADWIDTLAMPVLATIEDSAMRRAVRDRTVDLLRPALCDSDGNWTADYMRLRFDARL